MQKGIPSPELDKNIEGILNDVQFITGKRDIALAKTVVEQYDNAL